MTDIISPASAAPAGPADRWRGFATTFCAAALALFLGLYGFVVVLDPYGTRTSPTRPPRAIMDVNQRYMYPQLVRSGRFDAAVFGTSTIRLLDPESLERTLGGRFANLGLNAGTPWEQIELARLFLRHVPAPTTLIFGLDRAWCEPDADANRLTFRSFPPWLYDEARWNDLPGLLNLKSFEIAGRVALHGLGLMPVRIRGDGYEVFTPPESSYDLVRARAHLRAGVPSGDDESTGVTPRANPPGASGQPAGSMPALLWLAKLVAEIPSSTRLVFLFPPVHAAAQAPAGTLEEAVDADCKARIVALAARRGGTVIDFRRRTTLTTRDENYWDKLHYRQPIASRIVEALGRETGAAITATGEPADGAYRVLAR